MKEFLQTIFKTTEERIKNPFIGAFMSSWVLFNWQPILFMLFSEKKIEEKIKFIDDNFSNPKILIWFPLVAAIFYILVLPYISLIFDILLKHSLFKRNEMVINKQKQNIENQKQLAIEEIKLEEAKTEFRERNTHNKLVEELQSRKNELEIEFQKEKDSNRSIIEELKLQLANREQINNDELKSFERRYIDSRKEISHLTSMLFEKDEEIQQLKMLLRVENGDEKSKRNMIRFKNGETIIEKFDGNKMLFFNAETNKQYSENEIKLLMEKYPFERI